jgi:homoserine kinase type II
MSVYTPVERRVLQQFLIGYDVGALINYQGISAGVENTNYFVTTERGEFVLTLFESLTSEQLPYYVQLQIHLAQSGLPTPHLVADNQKNHLVTLQGRPAVLMERLPGEMVAQPNCHQCRELGGWLARLHQAGNVFPEQRKNERGPAWWQHVAERLLPNLSHADAELLRSELAYQCGYKEADLPRGLIHADLFHDNALFVGDRLTGIVDFSCACYDLLLYDLAISANDWCALPEGELDGFKVRALLAGYHEQRPLHEIERWLWPVMLRAAALRFWLSRLLDYQLPREGELTHVKDPEVFKQRLLWHRQMQCEGLWLV